MLCILIVFFTCNYVIAMSFLYIFFVVIEVIIRYYQLIVYILNVNTCNHCDQFSVLYDFHIMGGKVKYIVKMLNQIASYGILCASNFNSSIWIELEIQLQYFSFENLKPFNSNLI